MNFKWAFLLSLPMQNLILEFLPSPLVGDWGAVLRDLVWLIIKSNFENVMLSWTLILNLLWRAQLQDSLSILHFPPLIYLLRYSLRLLPEKNKTKQSLISLFSVQIFYLYIDNLHSISHTHTHALLKNIIMLAKSST